MKSPLEEFVEVIKKVEYEKNRELKRFNKFMKLRKYESYAFIVILLVFSFGFLFNISYTGYIVKDLINEKRVINVSEEIDSNRYLNFNFTGNLTSLKINGKVIGEDVKIFLIYNESENIIFDSSLYKNNELTIITGKVISDENEVVDNEVEISNVNYSNNEYSNNNESDNVSSMIIEEIESNNLNNEEINESIDALNKEKYENLTNENENINLIDSENVTILSNEEDIEQNNISDKGLINIVGNNETIINETYIKEVNETLINESFELNDSDVNITIDSIIESTILNETEINEINNTLNNDSEIEDIIDNELIEVIDDTIIDNNLSEDILNVSNLTLGIDINDLNEIELKDYCLETCNLNFKVDEIKIRVELNNSILNLSNIVYTYLVEFIDEINESNESLINETIDILNETINISDANISDLNISDFNISDELMINFSINMSNISDINDSVLMLRYKAKINEPVKFVKVINLSKSNYTILPVDTYNVSINLIKNISYIDINKILDEGLDKLILEGKFFNDDINSVIILGNNSFDLNDYNRYKFLRKELNNLEKPKNKNEILSINRFKELSKEMNEFLVNTDLDFINRDSDKPILYFYKYRNDSNSISILSNDIINESNDLNLSNEENIITYDIETNVDKNNESNNKLILLEYYLDGPESREEIITDYKKIVMISSDFHYENVLAYTDIIESKKESINIYWLINDTKILFDEFNFNISYIDSNDNGLIDRVEWIVPHLSNQIFEISIVVLNPYTYLRDGDKWIVAFNTTGIANLSIVSLNANWTEMLLDNNDTFDEMLFLNLSCGDNELLDMLKIQDFNDSVYNYSDLNDNESIKVKEFLIEDYECNETGYFSNYMIKAGYAILLFKFANDNMSVYDYAYDPSPPTHDNPYITPDPAYTFSNLTCNWNNVEDIDGDPVVNITTWYKNNKSIYLLYMPFEGGSNDTFTKDYSGYDNNGTVSGAYYNNKGIIGSSYYFNDSDIIITKVSEKQDDYTITLWFKLTNNTYTFKNISLGGSHSCGILNNGSVLCWGYNENGQIGDGTTIDRNNPTPINSTGNFSYVSLGYSHSCGILNNGSVLCWGKNDYGQIGDGTFLQSNIPKAINSSFIFNFISLNGDHSCGILINGSVMCWGRNDYGQIGDGTVKNTSNPLLVNISYNFSLISLGYFHSCGILLNGSISCWGRNNNGQLGDATSTDKSNPVLVNSNGNFSYISLGYTHTCAILKNNSLLCWGSNQYGQLGDGTIMFRTTPIAVNSTFNFSLISLGYYFSCGLLINGSLLCWGSNQYGQIGLDYNKISNITNPIPVNNIYKFNSLISGGDYICTIFHNGSLYCWGSNQYGNFGDGIFIYTYNPILINSDFIFNKISLGSDHSCGILVNGSASCWGWNFLGQVGDDTYLNNKYNTTLVNSNFTFNLISLGERHTCGLLINGSIMCWGSNEYGQIGDGTTTQRNNPVLVNNTGNFSQVSLGQYHSCGLLNNGSVMCWGRNQYGQIGDGTITQKNNPVLVNSDGNFIKISLGFTHTCGLLINGSIMCWGRNNNGQLGDGTTTQRNNPVLVNSDGYFTNISLGGYHTCGLLINGSIMCWGFNSNGQIGDGTVTQRNNPVLVNSTFNFSLISLGYYFSCGLLINGSIMCWGSNLYGELADGTTIKRYNPTYININSNFSIVSLGSYHGCGLLVNGSVMCWGKNNYGQLANEIYSTFPKKVIKKSMFGNELDQSSIYITTSFDKDLVLFIGSDKYEYSVNDSWHYLAIVKGNPNKAYLDGKLVLDNLVARQNISKIRIGELTSGYIDEVKVYDSAISEEQILKEYDIGKESKINNVLSNTMYSIDDELICSVTPADPYSAGITKNSSKIVIKEYSNQSPTHDNPYITPDPAYTFSNLTCNWNNVEDIDGDPVVNITTWYKNNKSIYLLYMPFEGGSNSSFTKDYSYREEQVKVEGATFNNSLGKIGGSYNFGNNKFLNSTLSNIENTTITFWFKTYQNYSNLIGYLLKDINLSIYIENNLLKVQYKELIASSSEILNNNTWYFAVIYFNSTLINISINNDYQILSYDSDSVFMVFNSTGSNVAIFYPNGDIYIRKSCMAGSCNDPGDDAFLVQNGNDVTAYIDRHGNLCIEDSDCNYYDIDCSTPDNDAFVYESSNEIVSYINSTGQLCLKGELKENAI